MRDRLYNLLAILFTYALAISTVLLFVGVYIAYSDTQTTSSWIDTIRQKIYEYTKKAQIALDEARSVPVYCRIVNVVDADTYDCEIVNVKMPPIRLRLYGIDAFEIHKNKRARKQARKFGISVDDVIQLGLRAKEHAMGTLLGKLVYVKIVDKGVYGRYIAIVCLDVDDPDNCSFDTSFNKDLLDKGFAIPYER